MFGGGGGAWKDKKQPCLSPLPPACWPVSLHCLPSGWMDGSAVCWSASDQQNYNVHFHIYAFSKCSLGWNVSSRLWQRSSFQIWSPIMWGNKRGWDCFETRQAQLGVGTHFGNFSKLYIGNLATVCFDELHICDIKVHPSQCSGDSFLTQEKHPYDEICIRQTEVPWYTLTMYIAGSALDRQGHSWCPFPGTLSNKDPDTSYVYTDNIEHVLLLLCVVGLTHHPANSIEWIIHRWRLDWRLHAAGEEEDLAGLTIRDSL